ncbi:C-x8-C-x5-C-x3-H type zinc finger protein [Arthroderma uncinatum]|uniref:C-x8-C-x5-C-x3-H type zinc finger protein n=1 Tax=Arthroderma uncinatum TaxID=74035 RepID=UPI00144ABB4B|nr:C-x8-C-x5-C-x3-H type zinc finger protein [Arthroderma uncinatum]KAF3482657.1 C-x8-C-x5-C-x3-H type zinc finger protein [Arthroderma uncinatum]
MDSTTDPNPPPPTDPSAGHFHGEFWGGINPLYGSSQPADQPFGIGMSPYQAQQPPAFESSQSTSPAYHTYTYEPQAYYTTQPQVQHHSTFDQQPASAQAQRVAQSSSVPANSLERQPQSSYLVPSSLQLGIQNGAPVNFSGDFTTRHSHSPYHSTIDPHFLSTPDQSSQPQQQQHQQQQQLYAINPAELERSASLKNLHLHMANGMQSVVPQVPTGLVGHGPSVYHNDLQVILPKPSKATKPRKKKDVEHKTQTLLNKFLTKPVGQQPNQPASESSSDYSSEESDDDLEIEEPPPEPSPLPAARPDDIEGRTRYDTLKVVWSPRNRHAKASDVRNSMILFSDLVKGVRDTWKARSEALKAAENQNLEEKVPALKKEVILQRRLLDLIVNTTLEFGHPSYIRSHVKGRFPATCMPSFIWMLEAISGSLNKMEKTTCGVQFGEHPSIVAAFYSFLLDRHTAADSDGPLTVDILKLMGKFTTMDHAMLEKTKNDKILSRFVKKGGNAIKQLAQFIMDNAAAVTKKKAEAAKSSVKDSGAAGASGSQSSKPRDRNSNPSQPVAGIKRAREDDNGAILIKRVVSPSSGKPVARNTATTATAVGRKALTAGKDLKSVTSSTSQLTKPKANIVTPKPTPNLFSSLMSASKKPGTSNAARAAAAAAAKEKPTVVPETQNTPPAPPPVAKPAFSFSETMANLNKPKERSPPKLEDDSPPETDEERQKRLRKEARRKLRVSWKPDSSLTEVRLFTHDPEEEIGYDDSMMRDVGDVAGEGRTLKLHRGLEDLEEEDEGWNEECFTPYTPIPVIDFSDLSEEDRNRNFTKTGGSQVADSPERVAQVQREATTLSVFYTSPTEIPTSPKEPPPPDNDDEPYNPLVPFGEPDHFVRARSQRYFDSRSPPVQAAPPVNPTGQSTSQPPVEISSLLKILQQNQQPQPQLLQQPSIQPNVPDIQHTLAQFTANPQVSQMQQTSQPGQTSVPQGLDFQKLLAVMNAQKQMQQATAFPQIATPQAPNLAAILSQLSNPAGQLQQQQQPQQQQDSQTFNQQQPYFEEGENKRGYEGDDSYDYNKRAKVKKHVSSVPMVPSPFGTTTKADRMYWP